MKIIKSTFIFVCPVIILLSCSAGSNKTGQAGQSKPNDVKSLIEDTAKIKSDLNDLMNAMTSDKPDTNKLKAAASDILSKDAGILSDSGIGKLAGKDPSANEAGSMLKKIRDAAGLTPAALDSIKKAAASLGQ